MSESAEGCGYFEWASVRSDGAGTTTVSCGVGDPVLYMLPLGGTSGWPSWILNPRKAVQMAYDNGHIRRM